MGLESVRFGTVRVCLASGSALAIVDETRPGGRKSPVCRSTRPLVPRSSLKSFGVAWFLFMRRSNADVGKIAEKGNGMKTDIALQTDILEELKFEPSVNAAHIGVTVKEGIVTLSGHVSSFAEKSVLKGLPNGFTA